MKTNWDKIRPMVWSIKYYKEDDKGNTKFYETSDDFDHSHFAEYVDNEDSYNPESPGFTREKDPIGTKLGEEEKKFINN